jgi:hypothetical protein
MAKKIDFTGPKKAKAKGRKGAKKKPNTDFPFGANVGAKGKRRGGKGGGS